MKRSRVSFEVAGFFAALTVISWFETIVATSKFRTISVAITMNEPKYSMAIVCPWPSMSCSTPFQYSPVLNRTRVSIARPKFAKLALVFTFSHRHGK